MSLRIRLAVALAALAALATTVMGLVAYATTRDRLYAEVDASLAERTARFDMGPTRAPRPGDSDRPDDSRIGGDLERFLRAGASPAPEGVVGFDSIAQIVRSDGTVVGREGTTALPVSTEDVALATSGGDPRTVSVTIDGAPYRIRTVPVASGVALQVARDVSETERVLEALRRRFALVGAGVVLVAALAGWLLARRTAAPIEGLARTAETVARTGDLGVKVPHRGTDETGRLANSFQVMVDGLAASRGQQRRLVQDAGHELKTPLTSLVTNIEVLQRHGDLPDPERAALLADLRSEASEVTSLVNELVELAAADARDRQPAERVDLDALARQVAARAARRHDRDIEVTGTGGTIMGVPNELERALSNLLDNAAKFSPAGTAVEVELRGGRAVVHDRGPGFDEADLPHVFDRFYRSDAARAKPGSGLGLSIVRQVADDHAGTAFAANRPGGGASVGIEFPIAQA